MAESAFAEWVILELMGHRRLGGYLTEQALGDATFLRIDVPGADGQPSATQFYRPESVYCITPTTEEMARAVALGNQPQPVRRWEFPTLEAPKPSQRRSGHYNMYDGPDDDEDEAL